MHCDVYKPGYRIRSRWRRWFSQSCRLKCRCSDDDIASLRQRPGRRLNLAGGRKRTERGFESRGLACLALAVPANHAPTPTASPPGGRPPSIPPHRGLPLGIHKPIRARRTPQTTGSAEPGGSELESQPRITEQTTSCTGERGGGGLGSEYRYCGRPMGGGKWWGTANLPAVVAGRCSDPCHHQPARAESQMTHSRTRCTRGVRLRDRLGKNG